jgi:threonine aldolase
MRVHLDGARIFNAAVALGVSAAELAQEADSVQFCLSKGLGAPVGSILAGTKAFITEARRTRKTLGGGMRQAGIMAAAGLVALDEMVNRLAEDHVHARRLAEALASLPGIELDLETVQTNMVVFRVTDPRFTTDSFLSAVWARGIRLGAFENGRIRAALHHNVSAPDVQRAFEEIRGVLTPGPLRPQLHVAAPVCREV